MKLKELLYEWLYQNHQYNIKKRTLLRYEVVIKNNIIPYYGDIDINEVSAREVQRWFNEMKERVSPFTHKPLSPSSINTALFAIRLSFQYAVDFDILENNPTTKVKCIPINRNERKPLRVFTREEQMKLERYIDKLNDDEYFVYILTLYTGLRLGEVMALTYKDINLKTGIISINKTKYKTKDKDGKWIYVIDTPKTVNSTREIPVPIFIHEKLKEMKRRKISNYVVCRNDGSELTDKVVVWRLGHIEKKLHMRNLCFHSLRHTFATRALENNMDIKTLSEILGHSNIVTTLNIYTHSLTKHKKQQMRRMKRII